MEQYDVLIIGGSYAGQAAAMSLGRALRKVLVMDSGAPCNAATPHSHNFLTQDGAKPAAINEKVKQELSQYPTLSFLTDKATAAEKLDSRFLVSTESGNRFAASRLLFATGVRNQLPELPGFAKCWGRSVIHCPYCHGYEVRDQATGILANGDMAFEMARLLNNWTKDLTLFTDGPSTLTSEQVEKLQAHQIAIVTTPLTALVHTEGQLQQLLFNDGTNRELGVLYARPPFEQHSALPEQLGCAITDQGFIKVDDMRLTTVPGVYASGDNTSPMRSVANAVAAGSMAGAVINHDLINEYF